MVHLLFFASGISGLIYQVIWVRAFGQVFGNTIYSASLVVAVFMLGLGAGSYVTGRWADRRYAAAPDSLLRTFGFFELAIGLLAIGVSALLPHLTALSAATSSYTRGPEGWYVLSASSYLARGALAAGLLAPITFLMGGTLTLLIRHLIRHGLDLGGWRVGLLYGVNTAGAALGCFLTDFALVPALGMSATQWVAFTLNMMAATGAFSLAYRAPLRLTTFAKATAVRRSVSRRRKPGASAATIPAAERQPRDMTDVGLTAAALALSGFAALGMEIVWFRHYSILLGEYRAVFSLLLTVILCGIGAGSIAGGWLHRRFRHPARLWMIVQAIFVVSTLAGLAGVDAQGIRASAAAAGDVGMRTRDWVELWFNARPILLGVGIPSLAMGFAFPLANALVQRVEWQVGHRAGLLYLANTAGGVGGSLAAGFLLLPFVGAQRSVTVLALVATAAILPIGAAVRSRAHARSSTGWTVGAVALVAPALMAWLLLPANYLISNELLFPLEKASAVSEGLTEVIAVTEGPDGGRVLVTNGHPMSSTELISQRYMRGMAHVPLLSIDRPERVLVLCFGVGNTAHAVTLHPTVQRVEVVDVSRHVLQHARYFADVNHDVLADPRVAVYVNDGRHHLRMAEPGAYDLITLEPPPIVHAGVASLYSRDFYALARSRLTPRGYISQWLPVFGVPPDVVLSMVRAFIEIFPTAVLLSGANTNLLLVGAREGATEIDPARLETALANAPGVHADLRRVDLGTLREIAGMFVSAAPTLAASTAGVSPVTDDWPIQEYGKRSLVDFGEGGIPPPIVAVDEIASWCPGCFDDGRPAARVEGLDTYLELTDLAYRSSPGGRAGAAPPPRGRTIFGSGYLGALVPESPALEKILAAATTGAGARYTRATELLEAGRFAEAIDEFHAVLRAVPDAVQAHNNLGVALASIGRLEEAIEAFEQALVLQPDYADARRNLARAREQRRARPGSS